RGPGLGLQQLEGALRITGAERLYEGAHHVRALAPTRKRLCKGNRSFRIRRRPSARDREKHPDVAGIRTARGIRHGCARIELRPAAGEDLQRHEFLLLRELLRSLDRLGKIGGVNSESECVEVVLTAHVAVAPGSGSQRALEIRQ